MNEVKKGKIIIKSFQRLFNVSDVTNILSRFLPLFAVCEMAIGGEVP